jgi:hypothetical protein
MEGFDKENRRYKKYYALNEEEKIRFADRKRTHISVTLSYTKGGTNYFTGYKYPRGYRISVTPVTISGPFEECTLLGSVHESGFCIHVESAERYKEKRFLEIASKMPFNEIGAAVAALDNAKAANLVSNI